MPGRRLKLPMATHRAAAGTQAPRSSHRNEPIARVTASTNLTVTLTKSGASTDTVRRHHVRSDTERHGGAHDT